MDKGSTILKRKTRRRKTDANMNRHQTEYRPRPSDPPEKRTKISDSIEVRLVGYMWMPVRASMAESARDCVYLEGFNEYMDYIREMHGSHLNEDNTYISVVENNIGISELHRVHTIENGKQNVLGYSFKVYCPEIFERARRMADV